MESTRLAEHDTAPISGQDRANVPALILASTAPALIAIGLANSASGYVLPQTIVSWAALVFGVFVFWSHGGAQVTAAGIYSLSSASFVGFAGLWWANQEGEALSGAMFAATVLSYLTHVGMYFLFWRGVGQASRYRPLQDVDSGSASWSIRVGVGSLAVGSTLSVIAPALHLLNEPLGFCGVILIALGVAARPGRLSWVGLGMVGLGIAVYGLLIFTGFGRLTVVALGCAAAVVLCGRFAGRTAKTAMLVGAPLLVLVLDKMRHDTVAERYGVAAATSNAQGTDSWATPLEVFSHLLARTVPFEHGHGSSFVSTFVIPFPRALWPEKPVQFGADLVAIFQPSALNFDYSMVALNTGEWFYNFGLPGLAAMVLVIGYAVRCLDGRMSLAFAHRPMQSARVRLLRLGLLVVLAAGMADLMWNGSSTFTTRALFRALVFVGLIFLVNVGKTHRAATVPAQLRQEML